MNPHKLTNLRPLPKTQAMTAGDLNKAFPAWRVGLRVQRHVFVDKQSVQDKPKQNKTLEAS